MKDVKRIEKDKSCAVFFDIDGTLLGSSESAWHRNIETINKVRRMGHKVLIATGRAKSYIPKRIKDGTDFDGFVSGAGASVYVGGRNIFKKAVPYETLMKLCDYFDKNDILGVLEGEEQSFYFGDVSFAAEDWIRLTSESVRSLVKPETEIVKLTVEGSVPEGLLTAMGGGFSVIQHRSYGEVIAEGYDKAFGMKCALEELKIPRERSIAVGDSLNDLAMIEYAGIGVAMGNAVEEIKAAADFVTDDVDRAGAAKILEKLFGVE